MNLSIIRTNSKGGFPLVCLGMGTGTGTGKGK